MTELESLALLIANLNTQVRALQEAVTERDEKIEELSRAN